MPTAFGPYACLPPMLAAFGLGPRGTHTHSWPCLSVGHMPQQLHNGSFNGTCLPLTAFRLTPSSTLMTFHSSPPLLRPCLPTCGTLCHTCAPRAFSLAQNLSLSLSPQRPSLVSSSMSLRAPSPRFQLTMPVLFSNGSLWPLVPFLLRGRADFLVSSFGLLNLVAGSIPSLQVHMQRFVSASPLHRALHCGSPLPPLKLLQCAFHLGEPLTFLPLHCPLLPVTLLMPLVHLGVPTLLASGRLPWASGSFLARRGCLPNKQLNSTPPSRHSLLLSTVTISQSTFISTTMLPFTPSCVGRLAAHSFLRIVCSGASTSFFTGVESLLPSTTCLHTGTQRTLLHAGGPFHRPWRLLLVRGPLASVISWNPQALPGDSFLA